MDKEKTLSMLGLARRAGQLSMGHDTATASIMNGKAKIIIFCSDSSPRIKKEFSVTIEKSKKHIAAYDVPVTMDEINFALGYRAGIITVNDINFATRIEQLIDMEECTW